MADLAPVMLGSSSNVKPHLERNSMDTITTSRGATVALREKGGGPVVTLDHPNAPDNMRDITAGRIVTATDGSRGFHPAPFAAYAMTPEVLRAIADLIDTTPTPKESN